MTNWSIASPAGTHDNTSRKSSVHTYIVRMEVKESMSVVERLETVCVLDYAILLLILYENIK
jgi:hypothetical protein